MVSLRNENLFCTIFLLECGRLRRAAEQSHVLHLIIDLDFRVLACSYKLFFRLLEPSFRCIALATMRAEFRP